MDSEGSQIRFVQPLLCAQAGLCFPQCTNIGSHDQGEQTLCKSVDHPVWFYIEIFYESGNFPTCETNHKNTRGEALS